MAKTSAVTLGGTEYQVPQMNIGQLERVTDLFAAGGTRIGFGVLRIAMERATPPVPDASAIEATTEEISAAVKDILTMSGLQPKEPAPGEAPAANRSPP
jgi:hypothetical protein